MASHMTQVALGHSTPIDQLSWEVCGLSKYRKKEIGCILGACMHSGILFYLVVRVIGFYREVCELTQYEK